MPPLPVVVVSVPAEMSERVSRKSSESPKVGFEDSTTSIRAKAVEPDTPGVNGTLKEPLVEF